MLQVISQGWVSAGYEMVLSNGQRLHIHKKTPTQAELDSLLLEYEQRLLNIDIQGEESDIQFDRTNNGPTDPGDDLTLGLPPS